MKGIIRYKSKGIKQTIAFVAVATLMAACGRSDTPEDAETIANTDSSLPLVSVIEAEVQDFNHYFKIQGAVDSEGNSLMMSEAAGVITSISVSEGMQVKKGQLIASISSKVIASNIAELQEQLKLAEYNFNTQQSLFDQGVGTAFNLKQAEGQFLTLQKTLKTVRAQKGMSTVIAPFSGVIDEVFPKVGEVAGPGSPIARLVNLEKTYVIADISESYLSSIGAGTKVDVAFPTLETVVAGLTIKSVGNYINPANRTIRVRVDLPANSMYVPNLVAKLIVNDYSDSTQIVLPTRTILNNAAGDEIVRLLRSDSVVEEQVIQTGRSYDGFTQVLKGLQPGMRVIDQGARKVYKGQKVQEKGAVTSAVETPETAE